MSRTDRVEGASEPREPEHHEVGGERRVAEWTRRLVVASGGSPTRAAAWSGAAELDAGDLREMSSLSGGEVRRAVARALGPAHADRVDEVVGALSSSVGSVLRHEVATRAEEALDRRLGELRTARHDDAKMARVLGRIGDE